MLPTRRSISVGERALPIAPSSAWLAPPLRLASPARWSTLTPRRSLLWNCQVRASRTLSSHVPQSDVGTLLGPWGIVHHVAPQIPIYSRARIFGSVKMGVLLLRSCEDRLVPLLHRPWRENVRESTRQRPHRPGGALASKPGAGAVEQLALLAQLLGLVLLVRQVRLWRGEGQRRNGRKGRARGEPI